MPQIHALLIAINEYHPQSGVSNLGGCVNDIEHIDAFLKKHYVGLNPAISILKNKDATRKNIIKAFQKKLIAKAKKGDTVLFCYSGHGSYSVSADPFKKYDPKGQDETFVCHDSRLPGHYDLTDKELAVLLSRIPEGVHTVVIADSCHSASMNRDIIDGLKLTNKRFTNGRSGERSLDSYLLKNDDYYSEMWKETGELKIPTSKHLLLSACDRNEEAWETTEGRGLFSTMLWNALEKNKDISYADLFAEIRNAIYTQTKNQQPTISPMDGFNPNRVFLMAEQTPNNKRHLVKYDKGKWLMNYGAIHGLPTKIEQVQQIIIGLFPDIADNKPKEQLLPISAKQVRLKDTELGGDLTSLDKSKTYRGEIQNLPTAMVVNIEGKRRYVKKFLKIYNKKTSPFLDLMKGIETAKYSLKVEKERLLVHVNNTDTLIHGIEGLEESGVNYIVEILEKIEEWERLSVVENPATKLKKGTLEVVFVDESDEDDPVEFKEDIITLDYPKVGEDKDDDGDPVANYYTLKARNTSHKNLYVALLHLSGEYATSVHFACAEIPKKSDWVILDDQHGLLIPNPKWNEVTDVFKILISTEPFDDYQFHSDGFEIGKIVKTCREKGFRAIAKRKRKSESDWYSRTITVNSIRKQKSIGSRAAEFTTEGITFHAHSSFQADIAFAPIKNSSRSIHPLSRLATVFDGNDLELLNLQSGTRSAQDKSIIELSGIKNNRALKKNPLEISVNQKLKENENIIPVAFDGEFIIPFGESIKQKDGTTRIKISEIPKSDASPTAGSKRSLGKAVWFCLLKAVGFKEKAFRLRWVSYDKEGKAVRHPRVSIPKIGKAKKILLVVHGIIGDTQPMLKNFKFILDEGIYDLILTYDYENLNEPIEEIAKSLNKKLEAVGLGQNDGKRFDILAHSMGGLVSRYMIEQIRKGDDLVDNLYMFGTPNGGSPFGEIPAYRDMMVKFLTIALNFGKPWLGPISVYLGGFNKVLAGSKVLTVTLGQMSADSEFTKKLWEKAVKGHTKYTIVAGNITKYETSSDKFFARFMEKTVLTIGGLANQSDPNDIAVRVEQIKAIPDKLGTVEYEICCHHLNYFDNEESIEILKSIIIE